MRNSEIKRHVDNLKALHVKDTRHMTVRVFEAIRDGAATGTEIAKAVGLKATSAYFHLKKLKADDMIHVYEWRQIEGFNSVACAYKVGSGIDTPRPKARVIPKPVRVEPEIISRSLNEAWRYPHDVAFFGETGVASGNLYREFGAMAEQKAAA